MVPKGAKSDPTMISEGSFFSDHRRCLAEWWWHRSIQFNSLENRNACTTTEWKESWKLFKSQLLPMVQCRQKCENVVRRQSDWPWSKSLLWPDIMIQWYKTELESANGIRTRKKLINFCFTVWFYYKHFLHDWCICDYSEFHMVDMKANFRKDSHVHEHQYAIILRVLT